MTTTLSDFKRRELDRQINEISEHERRAKTRLAALGEELAGAEAALAKAQEKARIAALQPEIDKMTPEQKSALFVRDQARYYRLRDEAAVKRPQYEAAMHAQRVEAEADEDAPRYDRMTPQEKAALFVNDRAELDRLRAEAGR